MSKFIYQNSPIWNRARGDNLLDTGAPFYDTYRCKDGKFLSVGCLEPQFYALFLKGLGIDPASLPKQNDRKTWPQLRKVFTETILTKTRDEWAAIFEGTDACVVPILEMDEVLPISDRSGHAQDRKIMVPIKGTDPSDKANYEPAAAPRLSRTPAVEVTRGPQMGEHSKQVLEDWIGISADRWGEMDKAGVVGMKK